MHTKIKLSYFWRFFMDNFIINQTRGDVIRKIIPLYIIYIYTEHAHGICVLPNKYKVSRG